MSSLHPAICYINIKSSAGTTLKHFFTAAFLHCRVHYNENLLYLLLSVLNNTAHETSECVVTLNDELSKNLYVECAPHVVILYTELVLHIYLPLGIVCWHFRKYKTLRHNGKKTLIQKYKSTHSKYLQTNNGFQSRNLV